MTNKENDFLQTLLRAVEFRSNCEFKSGDWTSAQWACALAGEVGELCNFVKKEWRDGADVSKEIEYEIADVFIYLCAIAISRGIDLEKVTREKFNLTSAKRGYIKNLV